MCLLKFLTKSPGCSTSRLNLMKKAAFPSRKFYQTSSRRREKIFCVIFPVFRPGRHHGSRWTLCFTKQSGALTKQKDYREVSTSCESSKKQEIFSRFSNDFSPKQSRFSNDFMHMGARFISIEPSQRFTAKAWGVWTVAWGVSWFP